MSSGTKRPRRYFPVPSGEKIERGSPAAGAGPSHSRLRAGTNRRSQGLAMPPAGRLSDRPPPLDAAKEMPRKILTNKPLRCLI